MNEKKQYLLTIIENLSYDEENGVRAILTSLFAKAKEGEAKAVKMVLELYSSLSEDDDERDEEMLEEALSGLRRGAQDDMESSLEDG